MSPKTAAKINTNLKHVSQGKIVNHAEEGNLQSYLVKDKVDYLIPLDIK